MHEALPTEDASLARAIERRDLVLVSGKGGTGKSTLVAALAELAARRRGRALALEFAVHPRLAALVKPGSNVQVMNLQAEEVVVEVLSRLVGMPAIVSAVVKNRVVRQFIRTSPAARETILLDELHHLVESRSKDGCPVIVDLPASGHAVTFLDTPRAVRRMLRVGPIAAAAGRAEGLLVDGARSELVVIALPEELPINETIELHRKAREIGVAARTVVVNQVPPQLLEPHERPMLQVIQESGEGAFGRFARAAQDHSDDVDQARAQIERLQRAVPARILEMPRSPSADPRACVEAMLQVLSR